MTDMFPITPADVPLADQIEAVKREIKMREQVYPRRVADGKMKQSTADAELARMRAVLATLEGLKPRGDLLKKICGIASQSEPDDVEWSGWVILWARLEEIANLAGGNRADQK